MCELCVPDLPHVPCFKSVPDVHVPRFRPVGHDMCPLTFKEIVDHPNFAEGETWFGGFGAVEDDVCTIRLGTRVCFFAMNWAWVEQLSLNYLDRWSETRRSYQLVLISIHIYHLGFWTIFHLHLGLFSEADFTFWVSLYLHLVLFISIHRWRVGSCTWAAMGDTACSARFQAGWSSRLSQVTVQQIERVCSQFLLDEGLYLAL